MESFGVENGTQKKATTFGMISRGNASAMEKMKPHFFRVMLDSMLQDAKIYIPTEFVKKYGSRLGSNATLKVDNGDRWEVELATDGEGLIWLINKGWEDFTKQHSLKQGDILVFRLEQDRFFRVMVFESTASEKKYRCKDVNGIGRLLSEVKVEQEVDYGTGKKEVEVSAGKLKQKKNRNGGGGEDERKEKLASPLNHVPIKVERPNHPSKTEMRGTSEPRRDNAAATSSENPNFSISIRQGHVKYRYMLLPTTFVYQHMMPGRGTTHKTGTVMVSGEEGLGSWSLSFVFRPHVNMGADRARFTGTTL